MGEVINFDDLQLRKIEKDVERECRAFDNLIFGRATEEDLRILDEAKQRRDELRRKIRESGLNHSQASRHDL